ncbi:MAG: ferritin family protein [Candidatus Omnitrophica bacterium]|nr:ferritin family protein [Candidatus Omnitrophota bacterium]
MSKQFVNDIIFFVIQVEKEGAEFYRKLANSVSNQAAKNVFHSLIKDELQHQKDFEELSRNLVNDSVYLVSSTSLVEILVSVTEKIKKTIRGSELVNMSEASFAEALNIAIHNEKEAIRIYTELLGVSFPQIDLVLPRIISEEKKHLALLVNLKAQRLG